MPTVPTLPTLPAITLPEFSVAPEPVNDVTVHTAITFTPTVSYEGYVNEEEYKATSASKKTAGRLLEAAYRKDPGLSMAQITQSEKLCYEATKMGVNDI